MIGQHKPGSARLDLGRIDHREAWEAGEVTHIECEDGPNGMDLHRGNQVCVMRLLACDAQIEH